MFYLGKKKENYSYFRIMKSLFDMQNLVGRDLLIYGTVSEVVDEQFGMMCRIQLLFINGPS